MKKLIIWILGKTKVGAWVKDAQKALDGKKQILAGLGTAIPGTLAIVNSFMSAENGLEYLVNIAQSPEFAAAGLGWGLVFNALKGEKIRHEVEHLEEEIEDLVANGPGKKAGG